MAKFHYRNSSFPGGVDVEPSAAAYQDKSGWHVELTLGRERFIRLEPAEAARVGAALIDAAEKVAAMQQGRAAR